MRRFLTVAVLYLGVLAIAFAAVAVTDRRGDGGATAPVAAPEPDDIELAAALEPFDGCDELLSYFKSQGLKRVGPYGLVSQMPYAIDDVIEQGDALATTGGARNSGAGAAVAGAEAPAARAAEKSPAVSGTNVQEAGVDEPDIVKSDGRVLVALAGNVLNVFDVDAGGIRRRGSLRLRGSWGSELLLDGDRVLVLGHSEGAGGPQPLPGPAVGRSIAPPSMPAPISKLVVVDISDPSDPAIATSLTLDGDYVSARLVEGVVRVVLRSHPVALPFTMPEGGGLRAERAATRRNRDVIRESELEDWLPYAVLTDHATDRETERSLLDCEAIRRPETFAGFGMVSVLSVDVSAGLRAEGAAGVVGNADTVYASTDNLYLSLHQWTDELRGPGRRSALVDEPTTELHQFDIRDPARARYVASGSVAGRLLNQWSLSEHDGVLRVATTHDDVGNGRSSSSVVTLRARGDLLEEIGRVDGLGKDEQIYAVRYDGDIGYVVTFRQTDPLYTLDLSDPRRPRVRGELKINGYSAYLHPVGNGRIVGVGQDATKTGQTKGSQISLFDISRLNSPSRLDQIFLGQGNSSVEYDHRAFLYWPGTATVVVPLQTWTRRQFSGVVVLRVAGDRLEQTGTIQHTRRARQAARELGVGAEAPGFWGGSMISRSLVLDDALLTVSDAGVLVSGLKNLRPRDWARFVR